ncbi:MAG: nitrile hydratase subunit beta [Candidatus Eremiobacteraeota bacterium]|nr:nitrile hydratase subunit beta [Candidatus Eremiobacteraeota bacterium]
MERPHDLGGSQGFGQIEIEPGPEAPFHHEWEARVFALNRFFLKRGTYTLDEFRYAAERMDPEQYRGASYYERWLNAIETLLAEKGVLE